MHRIKYVLTAIKTLMSCLRTHINSIKPELLCRIIPLCFNFLEAKQYSVSVRIQTRFSNWDMKLLEKELIERMIS